MEVQKVFEVGGTVFNSAASFKALISAASQDDVQPQAVIAAEALGNLMTVAPARISEAIDALGGNESIRMENLKLVFGLSSGGIRKIVRTSTGLIKFFLLMTALKLCFLDEEIGDIAFAALDKHQLLNHYPVSPSQLQRLVAQLSGHADRILPVELMHKTANELAKHGPGEQFFFRYGSSLMADLIMRMFVELQDDTTTSIELTGHTNAIWLCTAMLWLTEGDAHALANGIGVLGHPDSKICINVLTSIATLDVESDWTIRVFKKALPATDYVFRSESDSRQRFDRMPQRLTLHLVDERWLGGGAKPRELLQRLCAVFFHAFTEFLLNNGHIIMPKFGRASNDVQHNSVSLASLLSLGDEGMLEHLSSLYGWPEQSKDDNVLAAELASCLSKAWKIHDNQNTNGLKRACEPFLRDHNISDSEGHEFMRASIHLAVDAILTLGTDLEYSNRTSQRFVHSVYDYTVVDEYDRLFYDLLGTGADSERFSAAALQALLPGISPLPASMLIAHFNGTVVGFSRFWEPDFQQRGMLDLRCFPGDIRKDGFCYDSITEGDSSSFHIGYAPEHLRYTKLEREGKVEWMLHMPQKYDQYTSEHDIAHVGRRLIIRHWLCCVEPDERAKYRMIVSWRKALCVLAVAERASLYVNAQAEADDDELLAQQLSWMRPFDCFPHALDQRLIIPTWGSFDVLLLAAAEAFRSIKHDRESSLCPETKIVVHESGSLLATSRFAQSHAESFIIIAL